MAPGAAVSPPIAKVQVVYFKAFKADGLQTDGGYGGIWDMAMMYIEAYRNGGAPTAAQVHDYIEQLGAYVGVNGIYDFSRRPQRGLSQADLIERWDAPRKSFIPASKPGGYK